MTQKQVATQFGVARETVGRIERGERGDRCSKVTVRVLREKMRIWAALNDPTPKEYRLRQIDLMVSNNGHLIRYIWPEFEG